MCKHLVCFYGVKCSIHAKTCSKGNLDWYKYFCTQLTSESVDMSMFCSPFLQWHILLSTLLANISKLTTLKWISHPISSVVSRSNHQSSWSHIPSQLLNKSCYVAEDIMSMPTKDTKITLLVPKVSRLENLNLYLALYSDQQHKVIHSIWEHVVQPSIIYSLVKFTPTLIMIWPFLIVLQSLRL